MLVDEIYQRGTDMALINNLKDKTTNQIKDICCNMKPAINLKYKKNHKVIKGWKGKKKGLLQVLWERGHIDITKINQYVMKKASNNNTSDDLSMSLPHMLAECDDFKNEICQLEYIGKCIGVKVLITPKFHAELAGEGIEYAWGVSKSVYRKIPWEMRKGKDNFMKLVEECLDPTKVLSLNNVRRFSKKARNYMKVYQLIESKKNDLSSDKSLNKDVIKLCKDIEEIDYKSIEKMAKQMKNH